MKMKSLGILLIIVSIVLLILSALFVDFDSGEVVVLDERQEDVRFGRAQLREEVSFSFKYIYIPCAFFLLLGFIFIIGGESILYYFKSINRNLWTRIFSLLLFIIGIFLLIISSKTMWVAEAGMLIFFGVLLFFRDAILDKAVWIEDIQKNIRTEDETLPDDGIKPGIIQRIWRFKLQGPFLQFVIILISVVFIALFLGGIYLLTQTDLGEDLSALVIIGLAVVLIFLYAAVRFFPDLLRIFDSIEKHSRHEISTSNPLRFMFIRFTYAAFRVFAILTPFVLLSFFILRRNFFSIHGFNLPAYLNWAPSIVLAVSLIFFVGFFIAVIFGKKRLKEVLTGHSPFILLILLLIALKLTHFIGVAVLLYATVNIYKNRHLRRGLRVGAVLLCLVLLAGSMSFVFDGILVARDLTLDLAGFGLGTDLLWEGITSLLDNMAVAIPVLLIGSVFLMIVFWLFSDLVLTFAQIEKNFRNIGRTAPLPGNLHFWIFRSAQVLFITALGVFIYLLFHMFFYQDTTTFSSVYKQSGFWESIATYVVNMMRNFSILTFFKYLIAAGLFGNIVRLLFDVEFYTRDKSKKQGLNFFALNAYTRGIYIIAFVFAAVLVLAFFHMANLGEDFLHQVRFYTSWPIQAISPIFKSFGIVSAFFSFFILTFFASLGRRLLKIEKNLRPEEQTAKSGHFFGVKFYIYVTKTIAVLGAAAIIILPNVLLSRYESLGVFGNIVLVLAAAGFYILTAALPDLCHVLLKIEQHVRQGFAPRVVSEAVRLEKDREKAAEFEKRREQKKRKKIADLNAKLERACENKLLIQERFILGRLIRLGEKNHRERAFQLNRLFAAKLKKPVQILIIAAVVVIASVTLFNFVKDVLFTSEIPEAVPMAKYKSKVDNSTGLHNYFDRDFLIDNGIQVQRQEDIIIDNIGDMEEIKNYLDHLGMDKPKAGEYRYDDITTIFIDHFDELVVDRERYSDVFMMGIQGGDSSDHYVFTKKNGVLGYCYYNYASGWVTFSIQNNETPEERQAEMVRLASRINPDMVTKIFRDNLYNEESGNYWDVSAEDIVRGSFTEKGRLEGIVSIYDSHQSHAEGYSEIWLMRFEDSWEPIRKIYDIDSADFEIIDVEEDGLSEVMVNGSGGNMGEMYDATTIFSLKNDSLNEIFSTSGYSYRDEFEFHTIELKDVDGDGVLDVIDNTHENRGVEKKAVYTYKLMNGKYELTDSQVLSEDAPSVEDPSLAWFGKHDIDTDRSIIIIEAENAPDKRQLSLISNENEVLTDLDQEFSQATDFSGFELLAFDESVEIVHFIAADGEWEVHYYWNLSNNVLYYISKKIGSSDIYESKNLDLSSPLGRFIRSHYDSHRPAVLTH